MDEALLHPVPIELIHVGHAEFMVRLLAREDMIDHDQAGVCERDKCPLLATS
jgi:hypothetical protein